MEYYVKKLSIIAHIFSFKYNHLLFTFLVFFTAFPATLSAATYFVDPSAGSDSNPGTSTSPWKTVAWADGHAANGSTVLLRSGSYGDVVFSSTPSRTDWSQGVFYIAAPGATPIFTYIKFNQLANAYISVKGVIVNPVDLGTATYDSAIDIYDSSHVRVINCTVNGVWKSSVADGMTNYGVQVRYGSQAMSDILVEGCEIKDLQRGIDLFGVIGDGVIFRNNQIHHTAGGGIVISPNNADSGLIVIEGNHIHDQQSVAEGSGNTHGTGIAIRANNLLVRRNIIHDCGNTRGIRTYQDVFPDAGYTNLTFENNLVYDTINDLPVEFVDLGTNIKFNNNTIIGHYSTSSQAKMKYGASVTFLAATQTNGSSISFYNNVFVGYVSVDGALTNYSENNNIIWAAIIDGVWQSALKGSMTKILCYDGYTYDLNLFENSGRFFVGGSLFDRYSYTVARDSSGNNTPHGVDLNAAYNLASGSLAIGFGDASKAPTTDLTGALRGSAVDDGCYQFAPAAPGTDSSIQFDPIGNKTVAENSLLTFSISAISSTGAAITYSAVILPAGATFSNNTFTWTPATGQAGSYTIAFYANDGSTTASQNIVITVSTSGSGDMIIDNGTLRTSSTGTWKLSDGLNPYGADSLYSQNGTYTWLMSGQQSGTYEVLMYWTYYSNRTTNAAVDIVSSQGRQRVYVNQQINGGTWVSLGTFDFSGGGSVTITASSGSNITTCADAVCFRLIDAHPVQPPVNDTNEVIIDDGAPGTSSRGTWQSSDGLNPYGADSLYSQNGTYTWRMTGQQSGTYEVLMYWTYYSNRTTNAAVNIVTSQGTQQVYINQQINGSTWVSLGTFDFDGSGSVTITASNSSSVTTCADAVCFRLVDAHPIQPPISDTNEVIIDDGTPGTSSRGTWRVSAGPNSYGADSLYSYNGTYSWSFTPTTTGIYRVSMWWTARVSRSNSVPVNIGYSGGTADLTVNQQLNGGMWNTLGNYPVNAGTTCTVTITAPAGTASTCADAVQFEKM